MWKAALGNFDRCPRPPANKQPISKVKVRCFPCGKKSAHLFPNVTSCFPTPQGLVCPQFQVASRHCCSAVNLLFSFFFYPTPTCTQTNCPKASSFRTNWLQAAHLLGAVMNGLCRDCVNKCKDSQGHSCINNDSKRCLPFVPLTGCRHGSGSLLCRESSVNNSSSVH